MHRNAEIWSERLARLEARRTRAAYNFRHAEDGANPEQRKALIEQRAMVFARFESLERRVWNALCVAKGWRKT